MALNWFAENFVPSIIVYSVSFIALFIGSLTDLKTREVPDWLNYALIIPGAALNLLFSVIYSSPSFIISSAIGLAAFLCLAYAMFYAGQWGGGDSKMLIGLGAMLGISASFKPQFLPLFLVNVLFVGAIYGLMWSVFLAFKNKQKFYREFAGVLSEKKVVNVKKLMPIVIVLLFILLFLANFIAAKRFFSMRIFLATYLSLAFLLITTFYLWVFAKSIEKSCMHKLVEPGKLTEGDWIVNDVYAGKQYICGPKDLGIGKSQIRKLVQFYKQGKVNKILIKEGVPFVPSFLLAFVITLIFGNPLLMLAGI